jgi:hypothetical protein
MFPSVFSQLLQRNARHLQPGATIGSLALGSAPET